MTDEEIHDRWFELGRRFGHILMEYERFKILERAAQYLAIKNAIFTTEEAKRLQKKWLEEHPFNREGTKTGRFSSTKPNLSNIPRADTYPEEVREKDGYAYHTQGGYTWIEEKEKPMDERAETTVVKTDPDAKINCKDGGGCNHCGPKRKDKVHGKRAKVISKGKDSTKVKILEGDLQGEEAHCPPERVEPYHAERWDEPEPEPEPEKPKIVVKDFGYGPACAHCHATRGEDHCKGCMYEGQTI